MKRDFDEVSITLDGKSFRMFSGSVEFDEDGEANQIWIDDIDGSTLLLDVDDIVRERAKLEQKFRITYDPFSQLMHSHKEWFFKMSLWYLLSAELESIFADDISDDIGARHENYDESIHQPECVE